MIIPPQIAHIAYICTDVLMCLCAYVHLGGIGWQFWSVYVPASKLGSEAVQLTLEQIDIVHRMVEAYPDTFEMAHSAADVKRIFSSGKIASMCGIEVSNSYVPCS
jgi:membrane dipeptidase